MPRHASAVPPSPQTAPAVPTPPPKLSEPPASPMLPPPIAADEEDDDPFADHLGSDSELFAPGPSTRDETPQSHQL